MPEPDIQNRRGVVPGVIAVTATYVYFLLFAQYGFVRLIESRGGHAEAIDRAMACMGIAGLLSSFAAAWMLGRVRARPALHAGFTGCAVAALLALINTPLMECISAVLIGLFTGLLTVTLASCLRSLITVPRFGLFTGIATGIAYGICNIPALFDGPPAVQTLFCAAICVVGLVASLLTPNASGVTTTPACPALRDGDCRGWGLAGMVLAFLALVWMDSTAFATIQHATDLKGRTWGGPVLQTIMGITHTLAAVTAGALADAGLFRGLLLGTFALFAVAFRMLHVWGIDTAWAGPLYAAGISTYSVLLVLFPSARPDSAGTVPARWRSGIVYGVAGWFGSAMGVGMAQHLQRIPVELVFVSGIIILGGLLLAHRQRIGPLARNLGVILAAGAAGIAVHAAPGAAPARNTSPVERGRKVYIEEACITCHSQYIRPNSADVERWGPYRAPDFSERPPLIGNRRRGPDLLNAGLRRNADWHRIHLQDPRALAPGSCMPSYAHLFAKDSTRGDDLVAYLCSLGETQRVERLLAIQQWMPPDTSGASRAGRAIFEQWCLPCHGPDARGDGPLATQLGPRPAINLRKGSFNYTGVPAGSPQERSSLARIVRFGVPGTPMPGHELFAPRDVADVVAFLQTLNQDSTRTDATAP